MVQLAQLYQDLLAITAVILSFACAQINCNILITKIIVALLLDSINLLLIYVRASQLVPYNSGSQLQHHSYIDIGT